MFSQQEAGRISALPRGRFEHAAEISTAVIFPAQKVYQNREIQDLFGRYRTMKSFVSRDQLRETLFIK